MQIPIRQKQEYVFIEPLSQDRASLDLDFRNEQECGNGFMCKSCKTIKPGFGAIDEVVIQGVIDDAPFGLITKGLGLARKDFLFSLGEDIVSKNFFISKVRNYKGRPLDNWVAYHAVNRFPIRGGKAEATLRYCDNCGQVFYYASGTKYLYPKPPEGIDVFGNVGSSISFFTLKDLSMKMEAIVKLKRMRRVGFSDLEIHDAPDDGLGDFPMNIGTTHLKLEGGI